MALSAPKFIKDSYYIIASSYYFGSIKRFKLINKDTLVKRLDMVYLSNISIFLISKNFIELRVEKLEDSKVFWFIRFLVIYSLLKRVLKKLFLIIKIFINVFLYLKIKIMEI